jgi:ribose transport system permease protein
MSVIDGNPPPTATSTVNVSSASIRTRLIGIQRRFQIFQLLGLVVLFIWGASSVTDFTSDASIKSMLVAAAFLGLAGAGQTLVVLVGGIDFSIPAFIAAGSILVSELCGSDGWGIVPALALIIVLGFAFGAVNGYLSHRFTIQPLVVTLGMSSLVTGGLLVWTKGAATGSAPAFLSRMTSVGGTTFGIGIPPLVLIWVLFAIALGFALSRTGVGRRLYATGSNPIAAELTLIRTRRVWVITFGLSAVFASLLGVLLGGYTGSGNISLGNPYLFEGLAAVIVGGTAFGARGDYWKTVLGALLLTVLSTVLVGKGYSSADQQIIFGALILVVVAGYGRGPRMRDRI